MNASIERPQAKSTALIHPVVIGIGVAVAVAAGFALIQWTFAADLTHVLD